MRSTSTIRTGASILGVTAMAVAAAACGGAKSGSSSASSAASGASSVAATVASDASSAVGGASSSASSAASSASGAASGGTLAKDDGSTTIKLNTQSWVGSQANTAVISYVLQNMLGYKVQETKVSEIPAWNALSQGETDFLPEDWGHTPQYNQFVKGSKTVTDAGKEGIDGVIGWYTPKYVVDAHPEMATWEGLKTLSGLFKTAQTGDKGMLLDGAADFVTNDEGLVKNLKLNMKVVYGGSEAAEITQVQQAYAQKKPIIFYWYDPQWLNSKLDLVHVKLPTPNASCNSDPKTASCDYPPYPLEKYVSTKAVNDPKKASAVQFLKNWTWTSADQDSVALAIADKHMSPADAGKQWVTANMDKVNAWLKS
jgi:glycine betaine/proline transport system substrate-binding protein